MKDIHSHILYGIDDGARSIEESIEILEKLYESGVTDIILTPHYISNSKYISSVLENKKILNKIKRKYKKINLYLGNEVYIDYNLVELLDKKLITTLNNSRYLLIELPMNSIVNDLDSMIYELMRRGVTPIIAHPERYSYVQKNIKYLDQFIDMGVLLQGNYESLFGKYGKGSEKTLKKLLKKDYITFLGSDIHRNDSDIHTNEVVNKLRKILKDEDKISDLIDNNIYKVINDEEIK